MGVKSFLLPKNPLIFLGFENMKISQFLLVIEFLSTSLQSLSMSAPLPFQSLMFINLCSLLALEMGLASPAEYSLTHTVGLGQHSGATILFLQYSHSFLANNLLMFISGKLFDNQQVEIFFPGSFARATTPSNDQLVHSISQKSSIIRQCAFCCRLFVFLHS